MSQNTPDLYAKGWEAGVEQARRILSARTGDPHEALSLITDLLIDVDRMKKVPAADRRGGKKQW